MGHRLSASSLFWARWICQQQYDPQLSERQGLCLQCMGQKEQQKPPQFPAKLACCPGGIGVWDHTLFICGSFK